jgi:putative membrane protein insertion efficiency factor|tara:strand:- start:999 stop:1322 length:324 start_codon:yes stop_codon:yes gene_type:complete
MKKIIKFYFQQCKKALRSSESMISNILIFPILLIIKFYNFFISPMLGVNCRFFPTCSEYVSDSLKEHGLIRGGKYSLKRIMRCHPIKFLGGADGIDLVPGKNCKSKE